MILTDSDITEYQDLIRKRYGFEVTKAEALEDALSLIQFVKITVERAKKEGEN